MTHGSESALRSSISETATVAEATDDTIERSAKTDPHATWLERLASRRCRRLGCEFIWIGLGQASSVVGALVGLRVLTTALPQDVYGQLALGMTAVTFVNLTLLGPLGNAATRYFAPAWEAGALCAFRHAVTRLALLAGGVVLVVMVLLCAGLILMGQSRWTALAAAAMCFAVLNGYNSVLNGVQNAARQRAIVAWHQGLASWGRFGLAIALVIWLGPRSAVAMMGYGFATLLVVASQAWFLRRTLIANASSCASDERSHRNWSSEMIAYAWPFAIWGIPTWAHFTSDRWALQWFCSSSDVGLYAVLYQLGYYPLTIVTGLAVQLAGPIIYQRAGDASCRVRMQSVSAMNWRLVCCAAGLTAAAFVFVLLFHDFVFRVFVAPKYASTAALLPWMVLGGGLFATAQVACLGLMSTLNSRALIVPKIGTAVAGVLFNGLGAFFFGVTGIIAANILNGVVSLIWVLLVTARTNGRSEQPL